MIKSMTGFGIAQIELEGLTVKAEIKSLNGKQFDCSVKLPNSWRNFELELRNVISEKIIRGKVDCLLSLERNDSSSATNIKEDSFVNTYNYLLSLAQKVKADTSGLLEYVLCLPDLRNNESQMTEDEQKQTLLSVVNTALEELNRIPLLIIDELSYLKMDRERESLFFQVIRHRYEKNSLIITTNLPMGRWDELFTGKLAATAILDRLVHHCHILSITGDSYRVKGSKQSAK